TVSSDPRISGESRGSARGPADPASLNAEVGPSTSIAFVLINVRLFAGLRERAGTDRLEIELPEDARVADVLAAMASTPVGEIRPKECVVAVNREYADADEAVNPGDEVALVPPVSGGETAVRHVRVTAEPLDLSALAEAVRDPRAG